MSRIVEVCPDALAAVRRDVAATRDAIRDELGPLRWQMTNLNVPTGALHDVLAIADRLESDVLPTLDWHVARARDLASLRYGGSLGAVLPVVDHADPFGPPPDPFTQTRRADQSTVLSWPAAPVDEQQADRQATESSGSISSWFGDRWEDLTGSVEAGTDWLAERATDAWDHANRGRRRARCLAPSPRRQAPDRLQHRRSHDGSRDRVLRPSLGWRRHLRTAHHPPATAHT